MVRLVGCRFPRKTLASAGDDNTVRVWSVVTGKEVVALKGHTNSKALGCRGARTASCSRRPGGDCTLRVWDVTAGKEVALLSGHTGVVWSAAWHPDSKAIASSSHDGTVRIWNLATGKEETLLKDHTSPAEAVAWKPDERETRVGGQGPCRSRVADPCKVT